MASKLINIREEVYRKLEEKKKRGGGSYSNIINNSLSEVDEKLLQKIKQAFREVLMEAKR